MNVSPLILQSVFQHCNLFLFFIQCLKNFLSENVSQLAINALFTVVPLALTTGCEILHLPNPHWARIGTTV